MKSVLIATDLIKTTSGEIKVLETNTNVKIGQPFGTNTHYMDGIIPFIQNGGFQTVHCILPRSSHYFSDELNRVCNSLNIPLTIHFTTPDAITVPFIEDSDDVLIIRLTYDTTAIIDDDYCRDKFALQKIINTKSYGSKTYIPNVLDDFDGIEDFIFNENAPNFIIKKRFPNYNKEVWPKLYKIENLNQLNTLKSEIESDCYLQEFHNSELIDGKRCIIRTLDLLYGSNLDVLNICSFYRTSELAEGYWPNTFDENGLLAFKDRFKYLSHASHEDSYISEYVYDVDQEVVMGDGSKKMFALLEVGDQVKGIHIEGLDLDESSYDLKTWTGNYSDFIQNYNLVTTEVKYTHTSPPTNKLFLRVTLNDGNTQWDDLGISRILIKDNDLIRFTLFENLEVGDEIVTYNFETNSVEIKSIQTIEVVYKENQILGVLDAEPTDLYLPLVSDKITIIQHNLCKALCRSTQCANATQCGDCTTFQCLNQK